MSNYVSKVTKIFYKIKHVYFEISSTAKTPSREYLMSAKASVRGNMLRKMATGVNRFIYGPETLSIFEQIGYKTVQNSQTVNFSFTQEQ